MKTFTVNILVKLLHLLIPKEMLGAQGLQKYLELKVICKLGLNTFTRMNIGN
jgi:hypothetical protein